MKKVKKAIRFGVLLILLWLIVLYSMVRWSEPLFSDPYSKLLLDRKGSVLAAQVATDEQWRFNGKPESEKLKTAVLTFEDRYFYYHPGINPFAIFRAALTNIKSKKIVSGGSTITMQVVRLMRKNQKRTFWEKWVELNWAIGLELVFSKDEIIEMWLNHAPFGGNIVGFEAASLRYFRHGNKELSWAEAATIAVLPNAPSIMNPGKNRKALQEKRNRLLSLLHDSQKLTDSDYELSLLETIPESPALLPESSLHLLQQIPQNEHKSVQTISIDGTLQAQVQELVSKRVQQLAENAIQNAAVIVIHVPSMQIRAYAGNVNSGNDEQAPFVDIVKAHRSSGSILKPILYAYSVDQGLIYPKELIRDIPYRFGDGFNPKNADRTNRGLVNANEALSRSLNIPFVELLSRYGVSPFWQDLRNQGFKAVQNTPDYYGLSLILGGTEVSLFELADVYSRFAHQLAWSDKSTDSVSSIHFNLEKTNSDHKFPKLLGNSSIWSTFEAMTQVVRPENHVFWEEFSSSRKVAWKTGTSFGNKDAWSVGVTPDWVVGVWVGNADGQGRPNLTGVRSAAPILFDVFSLLPVTQWFTMPLDTRLETLCAQSGLHANTYCPETREEWIPDKTYLNGSCTYHQPIYLDKKALFRVNSTCYPLTESVKDVFFVLKPVEEWYFKRYHSWYRGLPPYLPRCKEENQQISFQIVYPSNAVTVYLPKDYDGNSGKIVLEAVHSFPEKKLYWHINEEFVGITQSIHKISFVPKKGNQNLVVIDEDGFVLKRFFSVKF